MSEFDWITCERSGTWAAALRIGIARRASASRRVPRIYEVRSLEELADRLAVGPASLALVEVHSSNLSKVMSWLAENRRHFPQVHFVALLDRSLDISASSEIERRPPQIQDIAGALLEAGMAEIADSPRRLKHVFTMAQTHAETVARSQREQIQSQSIRDWAWSLLPWQTRGE